MFGKDDLQTLTTVNNLAVYLDNIGEKEEALGLLGPSHPYTLDSTYNLACFLLYDNQLAEAWQAFTEARDGCVECFGWNHQGTLDCTERMVDILEAEGKLDEAVQLCKELLALVTLGSLLAAAGRMSEAEPCFRQAVEECSRTFGADDPYTKTLGQLLESRIRSRQLLEMRRRKQKMPERLLWNTMTKVSASSSKRPQDKTPAIRLAATRGLQKLPGAETKAALVQLTLDLTPAVRGAALLALGGSGRLWEASGRALDAAPREEDLPPELVQIGLADANSEVRSACMSWIKAWSAKQAAPDAALRALLAAAGESHAEKALKALLVLPEWAEYRDQVNARPDISIGCGNWLT
eukprot:g18527.t1